MTGLVIFLHAIISIILIVVILMQSGRGGGLTEGFASAESMFGAKTNEFMVKATTIFSAIFLATCLGLAILNAQQGKSLMSGNIAADMQELPPVNIGEPIDNDAKEAMIDGAEQEAEKNADEADAALDSLPEIETPPETPNP